MTLLAEIKKDQIQARKNRDGTNKALILTTLLAEVSAPGWNHGKRDSTNKEVQDVVKKFVKNLDEVIKALEADGKNTEMFVAERAIYESYLPQQLSAGTLEGMIDEIIQANEKPNMGIIMRTLRASGTNFDGKVASSIAKEKLEG